jgi:hypothetical protein
MIIQISPEELLPQFVNSWKLGHISNPTIDYADNAIYAVYEGKQIILFRFDKYGWINDNRYNKYLVSVGAAGILIQIITT